MSSKLPIKTFDTLRDLSEHFDSEVFRDMNDDSLLVQDRAESRWYRYAWTPGEREINFIEVNEGALPIVVQVYPRL